MHSLVADRSTANRNEISCSVVDKAVWSRSKGNKYFVPITSNNNASATKKNAIISEAWNDTHTVRISINALSSHPSCRNTRVSARQHVMRQRRKYASKSSFFFFFFFHQKVGVPHEAAEILGTSTLAPAGTQTFGALPFFFFASLFSRPFGDICSLVLRAKTRGSHVGPWEQFQRKRALVGVGPWDVTDP